MAGGAAEPGAEASPPGDRPPPPPPPPAPPDEATGADDRAPTEPDEEEETRQAKAPWHFKVILVGSIVYLGYRLYQGITWLAHHL